MGAYLCLFFGEATRAISAEILRIVALRARHIPMPDIGLPPLSPANVCPFALFASSNRLRL
jgi:hypothetical protein